MPPESEFRDTFGLTSVRADRLVGDTIADGFTGHDTDPACATWAKPQRPVPLIRMPNAFKEWWIAFSRSKSCFQDFRKRFSEMIKQKLRLLLCKQRRRKHETRDNSIGLCVRALQYVRACKNGSS
jgi:hypothetical protein